MSEKKQVLYDLRMNYHGPFLVEDFYSEVEKWIKEKGFEKEPKKKLEHVTKSGKKIEWVIEIMIHFDELNHGIVVLRALLDNVRETSVKKEGKKHKLNTGDVLIVINAFRESHIHGSFYQNKPVYYFIRTLLDKYVYNFWSDKYFAATRTEGEDLLKRIRSFFNLQKYKYE